MKSESIIISFFKNAKTKKEIFFLIFRSINRLIRERGEEGFVEAEKKERKKFESTCGLTTSSY